MVGVASENDSGKVIIDWQDFRPEEMVKFLPPVWKNGCYYIPIVLQTGPTGPTRLTGPNGPHGSLETERTKHQRYKKTAAYIPTTEERRLHRELALLRQAYEFSYDHDVLSSHQLLYFDELDRLQARVYHRVCLWLTFDKNDMFIRSGISRDIRKTLQSFMPFAGRESYIVIVWNLSWFCHSDDDYRIAKAFKQDLRHVINGREPRHVRLLRMFNDPRAFRFR